MTLVLIASSDHRLRANLVSLVRDDGFVAAEAADGLAAVRHVFNEQPDAILLDLNIDEVNGLELVRMLRAASDLAILALLAPADQSRGVVALDTGADDVIRPSTPPIELLARLKAALRRSRRTERVERKEVSIVRTGDIEIDRGAQTVTKGGNRVSLSRTEYRLLDALASRAGQVAPHRFLLATVWGNAYVDDVHYLRVYIGYLRAKLEDGTGPPRYLRSEWGVGYRLVITDADAVPASAHVDEVEESEAGSALFQGRSTT